MTDTRTQYIASSKNVDFGSAQVGDTEIGDVAGANIIKTVNHIYNMTTALEQVTRMLSDDVQSIESRLSAIEVIERQHSNERASLTRLITMLATESKTITDVQNLLERQISSEAEERAQRRRYLDLMLSTLIALAIANFLFNVVRALLGIMPFPSRKKAK